jgi:glucose uptake protein GlcU
MGLAALGVVLVVIGAVLMWALNVNLSFVNDDTLGLILFITGIGVIVVALVMNMMQGRTKHVEERRYDK